MTALASAPGDLDTSSLGEDFPLEAGSSKSVISERLRIGRISSASQAGWSLGGLWTMFMAVQVWTHSLTAWWVMAAAIAGAAVGLLVGVAAWRAHGPSNWQRALLMVATCLLVCVRAYSHVVHSPYYGTDEMAFDQYAAQVLLGGANPYVHSMAPSLSLFHVPDIFRTWTLNGGFVSKLSYPAGAFLAYLPALLAGMHIQAAVVTDVAFWVITVIVVYVLLPSDLKWIAVLLAGADVLFGNAVGGVTDMIYLPFALVALYQWDRFSERGLPSWRRWAGPVCLGLACCVKQTPWFLVPFLLAGIMLEARRHGKKPLSEGAVYAGIAAGVAGSVNLPFFLASPGAFIHGILEPLIAPTVPGGQGLIGLAMFTTHGGYLQHYSIAAAGVAVAAWIGFIAFYPKSKPALVALVGLIFFFPSRSFDEYFLEIAPMVLVAGTSVLGRSSRMAFRHVRWAKIMSRGTVGLGCLALVGVFWAVVPSPPMSLKVLGEHSTGQLDTVDRITVEVSNRSRAAIEPHYSINATGQQSAFWYVVSGPRTIPPMSRQVVVIEAPNPQSMPSLFSGFVVNGYLAHPAIVSTSNEVVMQHYDTILSDGGMETPVPVGKAITFRVEVTNDAGMRVRKAGIAVDLGQVVYGQTNLGVGESSINGNPEGKTPVLARTNGDGVATFVVRGVQQQTDPVFYEAWLVPPGGIPVSYSNIVDLQMAP
ncbi:MAG: hypothetical protein M1115_06915 [Actinobacteria bacterium]|nr:hypothetical protein [Actinomycetota bacterium]